MAEHTPTPWQANAENWLSVDDGSDIWHKSLICQVNGKKRPEAEANRERVIACVNAFHDPSRTIATEQITEELFWRMYDMLETGANTLNLLAENTHSVSDRASARYLKHQIDALLSSLKVEQSDAG